MTGETIERVAGFDEAPLYRCTVCGATFRSRLPDHEPDCEVIQ